MTKTKNIKVTFKHEKRDTNWIIGSWFDKVFGRVKHIYEYSTLTVIRTFMVRRQEKERFTDIGNVLAVVVF